MACLNSMFPQPQADALDGMLGHDVHEASAWWQGADLAGMTPGTVQDLLLARRLVRGHAVRDQEVELAVSAIGAFLLPVCTSVSEIDALHGDIAAWIAPLLDERVRLRVFARADAALELLDDGGCDREERIACIDAVQATAMDITLGEAFASVNVVRDSAGRHVVAIIACPREDEEDCVQIGTLPFAVDDGNGPNDRARTPVAPVPLSA